MPWRNQLSRRLSKSIGQALLSLSRAEAARLCEIRVRTGQPVCWVFADGKREDGPCVTPQELDDLVSALCGYSRYAYEEQMKQGYISLSGGHRAGICGQAAYESGEIVRMNGISSVCIRIARRIEGASETFRHELFVHGRPARVMLLGPPGCGKTTALRDAARYLSSGCGLQVAVADEREELFSAGEAAVDVLSGARKAQTIMLLMRSMAPQVLVTDEIGRMEDAYALLDAVSGGVGVLASAHAASMEDVLRRPALRLLFKQRAFDRYILLGPLCALIGVWNAQGERIREEANGKLGGCRHGDGGNQYDCLLRGRRGETTPEMDSCHAQIHPAPV